MLRNSKILKDYLKNDDVELLNSLKFSNNGFLRHGKVDNNSKFVEKYYYCCGGTFTLQIYLNTDYVQIHTPYDKWWCDNWQLSEFTKELDFFQQELKSDLQKLRKAKIIS